ncbi:MAG: prolipoprotein diacylglyceryl transferase family protein [Chitinophagales bacterium]
MRHPLIDLGTFPIYKTMGGLGFILGLLLLMHNLKNYNIGEIKKDRLLLLLAISFLIGMALSNIGNWLVMPSLWHEGLLARIQHAGLSYYFGLIGFLTASAALLKIFDFKVGECLNYCIPSLLLFHSLGRMGCSLAGCCYGKIVNWDFFSIIAIVRFPAREIEVVCLFVLFLIVQFIVKRNRLVLYCLTYPLIRFFLEFGRGDYRGISFMGGLSIAQVISVVLFTAAVIYLLLAWFRGQSLTFLEEKPSGKLA